MIFDHKVKLLDELESDLSAFTKGRLHGGEHNVKERLEKRRRSLINKMVKLVRM